MGTDERTSEQVAADNALDEAIRRAAEAYGWLDGAYLTNWVVAAATDLVDGREGIAVFSPSGSQPVHIALGLLQMGQESVLKCFRGMS